MNAGQGSGTSPSEILKTIRGGGQASSPFLDSRDGMGMKDGMNEAAERSFIPQFWIGRSPDLSVRPL